MIGARRRTWSRGATWSVRWTVPNGWPSSRTRWSSTTSANEGPEGLATRATRIDRTLATCGRGSFRGLLRQPRQPRLGGVLERIPQLIVAVGVRFLATRVAHGRRELRVGVEHRHIELPARPRGDPQGDVAHHDLGLQRVLAAAGTRDVEPGQCHA